MSYSVREPATIPAEVTRLLALVAEERAQLLGRLEALTAAIMSATEADRLVDDAGRDRHCSALLELPYDVLGDCEPVEMLCSLLGYEIPEDPAV